ncbi:MAG: N-acetyl-gamma-glutamyl-phosphate reductase [Gemmatimonadaceae bacterium]|nr:N-acetyl-gamma-glutamyl-phosphate reductase [Gemmatimonadaceae bacterium]NUO95670.1 N-acetyl-gamma-glutamyl-phosphate reductase [Gemmatimonadaceae bacterium]NUP70422.1 N-acetyl-gamma-glutamyl-phosphate reductase [Gemmatimonadaceae bacterium]NUR34794.1 N-acetyl-gamma-glutamyl-phosphate reductase [Gemmatimonadaceae bacterium]NUS33654.1 N-acetyl-gamma-glutamyl-phosphate reductase [Gemmatimonadaceae bacterium]
MNTIPVGVLGASGYAGREICALVARHPRFSLAFATANEQRGQRVRIGGREITFAAPDDVSLADAAVVFSALPHGASLPWVERSAAAGARVVDLSSDLRPGHGGVASDELVAVPYGMPELGASTRAAIRAASIVANPGCYPTSILLALAPLQAAGLIPAGATIVANAASGVSGAGNSPKRELLFAEVADDYRAYGVGNTHRHLHEMRATLKTMGGDADLVFTPHLLPVARGILATITLPLVEPLDDPVGFFRHAYAGEPFVEIADEQPTLREVIHRNVVRVSAVMLGGTRQPTLLVTSAIDNLVKGAAGQAVQNANLMCGIDECAGLPA